MVIKVCKVWQFYQSVWKLVYIICHDVARESASFNVFSFGKGWYLF